MKDRTMTHTLTVKVAPPKHLDSIEHGFMHTYSLMLPACTQSIYVTKKQD